MNKKLGTVRRTAVTTELEVLTVFAENFWKDGLLQEGTNSVWRQRTQNSCSEKSTDKFSTTTNTWSVWHFVKDSGSHSVWATKLPQTSSRRYRIKPWKPSGKTVGLGPNFEPVTSQIKGTTHSTMAKDYARLWRHVCHFLYFRIPQLFRTLRCNATGERHISAYQLNFRLFWCFL